MKLIFAKTAREAYDQYKSDAPELAQRIKEVLLDILNHPTEGLGAPVALDGPYTGLWQRTFIADRVLVYSFDENSITIVSIGDHVAALKAIHLDAYSKEEEDAVMAQMAANRGKDSEPKVGIFWYNRARNQLFGVISHRVSDYTKANASEGRITCSEMHEDVWKKEYYKQRYQYDGKGPFIGDYQYKPRGRVFYHMDDGTYEVAVGKWLEEYPQAYDIILKEFNLPPERTSAKYAIHWDIGQTWR